MEKWYLNVRKFTFLELSPRSADRPACRSDAVRPLQEYLHRSSGYLTEWYHGETTNTAFVESTINQVVSKRFVKKQQKSAEEVRGGQSHSQTRSLGWTIANHLAGQAHHSAHQGVHGDTQRLSFSSLNSSRAQDGKTSMAA